MKLVMVPGMFSGKSLFDKFVAEIGSRWPEIEPHAINLPGHGGGRYAEPDPILNSLGLLDYAQFLVEYVRKIGWPVVLMGHSMGSLTVMLALEQLIAEGLVSAYVLLSPAAPKGIKVFRPSVVWSFIDTLCHPNFWAGETIPPPLWQVAWYAALHELPLEERYPVWLSLGYESGKAAKEMAFDSDAKKVNAEKIISSGIPGLVVVGGRDRMTPPPVVKKIVMLLHCDLLLCNSMGHLLPVAPGWEDVIEFILFWAKEKRICI